MRWRHPFMMGVLPRSLVRALAVAADFGAFAMTPQLLVCRSYCCDTHPKPGAWGCSHTFPGLDRGAAGLHAATAAAHDIMGLTRGI